MRRWGASGRSRARMKRVLRDVVLGAVSCVATIGAGSGVLMAAASDALAQDNTATPTPAPQTAPTPQAPTPQAQTPTAQAQTPQARTRTQARTPTQRTRTPAQRPGSTPGQQQAAPTVLAPIQRIVVQGNQRIEPATVISYLLIHPGDTFDPERVDLSLKTLFATGLFADVQIEQRGTDL